MHSEHLRNVRIGYIITGWLIAVAAVSLFILVFISLNMLDPDGSGSSRWITLAVALGFLAGGSFVGFLTGLAPILHGILIGLTSLVAWAVVNAVVSAFFPDLPWTSLNAQLTINLLLVQIICAVVGTRFGYRFAVARVEP
jgi:MFS family permease